MDQPAKHGPETLEFPWWCLVMFHVPGEDVNVDASPVIKSLMELMTLKIMLKTLCHPQYISSVNDSNNVIICQNPSAWCICQNKFMAVQPIHPNVLEKAQVYTIRPCYSIHVVSSISHIFFRDGIIFPQKSRCSVVVSCPIVSNGVGLQFSSIHLGYSCYASYQT